MTKCRPFTIGDLMILIAALAVGFWGMHLRSLGTPSGVAKDAVVYWCFLICPTVFTMTLAFIVLCLRHPRMDLGRMSRQPGHLACGTAVLSAAITFVPPSTGLLIPSISPVFYHILAFYAEIFPCIAGNMIIAAWGLLLLSGNWCREAGWIDGLGTAIGICWIVLNLILMLDAYR